MGFLQVIKFFIFLLFAAMYPRISSQTLNCGNNTFFIQYPFRLLQEGQSPHHQRAHSDHFFLKCNSQGVVVLNLPFSGDFYVRDIDYFEQKIELYDPGNCLLGRLMNLSLFSSPFVAITYQNYTFFSCPPESLTGSLNVSIISCLSNSSASILATSLLSRTDEIMKLKGCKVIVNQQIPNSFLDQYENNGFDGDLYLAWSAPSYKGKSPGRSVLGIIILCFITISTAILGLLFCIGCCLRFTGLTVLALDEVNIPRSDRLSTTRVWEVVRRQPQPSEPSVGEFSFRSSTEDPSIAAAASRDKFLSTEELMIGGRQWISGPNSDSCPICLEEYQAVGRLRRVRECDHCFHAHCLEEWLERKNTCPVCRIRVK